MEQQPEAEKKRDYSRAKCVGIVLLIVLLVGLLYHVHHPPRPGGPKPGMNCVIQFRRDALGAAGSPISAQTDIYNNSNVSLAGELVEANRDDFVLRTHNDPSKLFWIPRENVLLIEYAK